MKLTRGKLRLHRRVTPASDPLGASNAVSEPAGNTEAPSTSLVVTALSPQLPAQAARLISRRRLKPVKGYAHVLHILLSALMPALVFVFIRLRFVQLAVLIVLITKWRMFAVRPRFWPAIIRANSLDIIVGLSTVVFMAHTHSASLQLLWAGLYMVWQVALKPGRSVLKVSSQAIVGQTYGLMALFIGWPAAPLVILVLGAWVVCYLAARHFLTGFDEPYISLYSHTWGYFAAALAWLTSHWLLFYNVVAQPTLLLTVLGFGLGGLIYLQEMDRLSILLRRQIVFIMIAVIVVVLVFSDWGDKIV